MIRDFQASDMDQVIDIWLNASIQAHDFVDKAFWVSKAIEMREIYIPASESYVYEESGFIKGFVSLYDHMLAAIFVLPDIQGQGVGEKLMQKAKNLREKLSLSVYKENTSSMEFYLKRGFKPIQEQIDEHTGHIEVLMEFTHMYRDRD